MLREQGFHPDDAAAYPYPYRYGPGSGIVGGLGVVDDPAEAGRWGEEIREAEAGVDADEDTRARAGGGRGHRSRAMSDPAEGDALVSLGRLVKGAGKSLWRSISMKEVRSKEGRPSDFAAGAGSEEGAAGARAEGDGQQPPVPMRKEKSATLPRKTEVHLFDDPDARAPSDEGGVWEEVVEEESWKKLLSKPPSSTADPGEQQCQGMPRSSVEPRVEVKRSKRVSTMDVFAARIR
ncbi:hypothetical protein BD414DRAFT_491416 [Trametes punicea]|nr:hypothetical protein BD414DRAFT_491416 [Trametes punicea]